MTEIVPERRRIERAGLSVLALGPVDAPVALVFLHATGFHGHLYADLLAPLAADRQVWAVDLRGHGRTALLADPARLRSWNTHRDDLLALLATIEGGPVVLAGHSMGATTALLAAARAPERTRALVLAEPVILSPLYYVGMAIDPIRRAVAARSSLARGANRRRAAFESVEAAYAAYHGRGAFRSWPDAALRAYVEEGFTPAPTGGVRLRCDPAWEAACFAAQANAPWAALRRTRATPRPTPLWVRVGARGSTLPPANAARLVRMRPDADVRRIGDASHFLPQEQPEIVREALRAAMEA